MKTKRASRAIVVPRPRRLSRRPRRRARAGDARAPRETARDGVRANRPRAAVQPHRVRRSRVVRGGTKNRRRTSRVAICFACERITRSWTRRRFQFGTRRGETASRDAIETPEGCSSSEESWKTSKLHQSSSVGLSFLPIVHLWSVLGRRHGHNTGIGRVRGARLLVGHR